MSDVKLNPKADIPILKTLLNDLTPVGDKWRKIGIQLGIPNFKLRIFEKDDDPLINSLDYWLHGNTDIPITWESVVAALESPSVGELGLAKELKEKYCMETTDKATKQTMEKNVSSSTPEKFPYLQITDLTEEQKDELMKRLVNESDRIKAKFAVLVSRTSVSLKNNDVSVGSLKLTFKSLGLDELVEKLHDESDLTEALIEASNYWSFFDYEAVTSIISSYCKNDADLQQEVESYISSFKIYCQRRLCEVPIDNFETKIHKKTTKLHVKMDEAFTIPLNKVKKIEGKLSYLLDTSLRLLKIEDGCIELIFSCLCKINPLNSQQEEDLLEMGVLRLYDDMCEHYHAPSQDKSPSLSLPPSQVPAVEQLSSIDDLSSLEADIAYLRESSTMLESAHTELDDDLEMLLLKQVTPIPRKVCDAVFHQLHDDLRKYLNVHEIYPLLYSRNLLTTLEESYLTDQRLTVEEKVDTIIPLLPKYDQADYLTPFVACLRESSKTAGVVHTELADDLERLCQNELKRVKEKKQTVPQQEKWLTSNKEKEAAEKQNRCTVS